ncbi:MAG TPA: hypothetical protein VMU51_03390 [Mycobacteriales bacterium]|nr:hypothetical protein [Mycobacteriales bacterium]
MTGTSGPGPDDPQNPQYPPAPQYPSAPPDPSAAQYPSAPQYDYPAYAGGPGGFGAPGAPRPPMPPTVHWASIAIIVRTVFSIISTLVIFARLDTITDEVMARSSSDLDRDSAKAAVVFGAVIALVVAVLLLGLAVKVRQGRNWARIVAIVLAVLGILGGLAQFAQPYGGLIVLLGVVDLALAIATLALLVMPASNEYFKAGRPGR